MGLRLLMLAVLLTRLVAGVASPDRIVVEPAWAAHWWALFAAEPVWPTWDVVRLHELAGARWPSLLAACLCYRGPAWEAGVPRPAVAGARLRAAAVPVHAAILRELRYRAPTPALVPALAHYVEADDLQPALLMSALRALHRLDADAALAAAGRLVLSAAPPPQPLRQQALVFLIAQGGRAPALRQRAVRWALFAAGPLERLRTVSLLQGDWAQPLLGELVAELLQESDPQRSEVIAAQTLARALARLAPATIRVQRAPLVAVLPTQREDGALAVAAALQQLAPDSWSVAERAHLVETLERRIARSDSLALRHGLLALLVHIAPSQARRVAGLGSPWGELARHREEATAGAD